MRRETWDDRKIEQMIANYRRHGASEGGVFPLSDLLAERLKRVKSEIDTVALARALDPKAVVNIANDAGELGMVVGPDPTAFVERQRELAREAVIENLPDEGAGA